MQGLFEKYVVSKADGSEVDPEAMYFVLRLDTDPAARAAVMTYADACAAVDGILAQELRNLIETIEPDTGLYTHRITFNRYQDVARETAIYPEMGRNFVYPALGLCGEAGEVAEKIKKVLRDRGGEVDFTARIEILRELGDVLWYAAALASELGLRLGEAAEANLRKLRSRKERNMLHGNGDER